jgi:hypothetical protein
MKRMKVYLAEMFPLPARAVYAVLLYTSTSLLLHRIHGLDFTIGSEIHLIGVWTVFAMLLILRLMDELKDLDTDRELFSERPLPSGRVCQSDIGFSLGVMILLVLLPNAVAGNAFLAALGMLCYALLMFRYFFIPNILRRYLLLNLATHNPIIPILFLYIVVLFALQHDIRPSLLDSNTTLLVIGMLWSGAFAWEISRKIRSQEEENAYVTYSQIFGRVGAVLVAAGAQTIGFALALHIGVVLSLSWVYFLLLGLGFVVTMAGNVRFLVKPNPVTSKLKPFAEGYVVAMILAVVVELGIPSS